MSIAAGYELLDVASFRRLLFLFVQDFLGEILLIGEAVSGFGWNGEYYDATTGQVYLRARFYEPEQNRFSQKDLLRGSIADGTSLNRYLYCQNDPVNFIDSSGENLKSLWNSAKSAVTSTVKKAASTVSNAVSKTATAIKNTAVKVTTAVQNTAAKV